jgi:hypothetical protein
MKAEGNTCVFFSESESICHLFYECVVAKRVCHLVSESIGFQVGNTYESVAKLRLCNKRFGCVNMITSTVLWCI